VRKLIRATSGIFARIDGALGIVGKGNSHEGSLFRLIAQRLWEEYECRLALSFLEASS
jgi:hypothetical protein